MNLSILPLSSESPRSVVKRVRSSVLMILGLTGDFNLSSSAGSSIVRYIHKYLQLIAVIFVPCSDQTREKIASFGQFRNMFPSDLLINVYI